MSFLAWSTSLVEFRPFEGEHFLMGLRPCERLGDLRRAGFSRNHGQIRNPHEHLKVGRDDVEVRRAVIVGVHPYADGIKALQCRHTHLSTDMVQLLHFYSQLSSVLTEIPSRP